MVADAALAAVGLAPSQESVLDKGYHSGAVLVALAEEDYRSYVSGAETSTPQWKGQEQEQEQEQRQLYANRRRVHGPRPRGLQATRAELNVRSTAHLCETGGMRRVHLRGRDNILKRLLIQAAGFNLALIMRKRLGVGKPRGLQGASGASVAGLRRLHTAVRGVYNAVKRLLHLILDIPTVAPGVFHMPIPE